MTPAPGSPAAAPRPPRPWVADVAVLAGIVGAGIFLLARLGDPLGTRPDSWSEAEVIVSGWGYARDGFLAHAGLPQHQVGPPLDPYFLYANYPVLSNVLYGVLHVLGADSHGWFRLPAVGAALVAVWCWYRLVAALVDRTTGAVAALALVSSFGFLAYADNIHQQAYPLAPLMGALLCLVAAARDDARRGCWSIGCAVCLVLVGLLTVEWHLWVVIAVVGLSALCPPRLPWPAVALLLLGLAVGPVTQWGQGRLGSPVPVDERPSVRDNLYRRSIGFAEATDTPRDATGSKLTLRAYPAFLAQRFAGFFLLPVWGAALLLVLAVVAGGPVRASPARWPASTKLLLILLLAAAGWMGTMMQQTAVHPATLRHLLPFYALLCGVLWTRAARAVRTWRRSVIGAVVLVGASLVLLRAHGLAAWGAVQMHRDPEYEHPLIREPGWWESTDLGLLAGLPADSVILTNHNRLPLIRYWARRPTYLAMNRRVSAAPDARSYLDLMVNYLRGLYGHQLPHLVYLYRVLQPTVAGIDATLAQDPLLRALTTGSFDPLGSLQDRRAALQAFNGRGGPCPVLASGGNWRVFDMTPILPELVRRLGGPIPRLVDLPAPR